MDHLISLFKLECRNLFLTSMKIFYPKRKKDPEFIYTKIIKKLFPYIREMSTLKQVWSITRSRLCDRLNKGFIDFNDRDLIVLVQCGSFFQTYTPVGYDRL